MNMDWIRTFMAKLGLGHPPASFNLRVTSEIVDDDGREFFKEELKAIEDALRPYAQELATCGFHVRRSSRFPKVEVNYLDDAGQPLKGTGATLMYELTGYLKDWKVTGPGLKRKVAFEHLDAATRRFMEQVREMPQHQPPTSAAHGTPGKPEPADR